MPVLLLIVLLLQVAELHLGHSQLLAVLLLAHGLLLKLLVFELEVCNHGEVCLDTVLEVGEILLEVDDLELEVRILLLQPLILNIQRVNLILARLLPIVRLWWLLRGVRIGRLGRILSVDFCTAVD